MGLVLCLLLSNLHLHALKHKINDGIHVEQSMLLIQSAMEAIQIIVNSGSALMKSTDMSTIEEDEFGKKTTRDCVRKMETVCSNILSLR